MKDEAKRVRSKTEQVLHEIKDDFREQTNKTKPVTDVAETATKSNAQKLIEKIEMAMPQLKPYVVEFVSKMDKPLAERTSRIFLNMLKNKNKPKQLAQAFNDLVSVV